MSRVSFREQQTEYCYIHALHSLFVYQTHRGTLAVGFVCIIIVGVLSHFAHSSNHLRHRKRAVELQSSYPCEDSICRLLQFVVVHEPSMHFMVLEYMTQGTVKDAIAAATDSGVRIDPIQAIDAAIGVLAALVPLHRDGIVHCGIRPSRVGVTAGHYKLLGFGTCYRECKISLSRADDSAHSTHHASEGENWSYWSPEQCQEQGLISAQTDLWAVGVLLYHCISGRLPFESREAILGPDPAPCLIHHRPATATGAAVVPSLAKIVCTALKKSGVRFKSAERMLSALEDVRRELVVSRQRAVERKHQHKIGEANLQQYLSQAVVDGLSALSNEWRRYILPQDSVEGERLVAGAPIECLCLTQHLSAKFSDAPTTPQGGHNAVYRATDIDVRLRSQHEPVSEVCTWCSQEIFRISDCAVF